MTVYFHKGSTNKVNIFVTLRIEKDETGGNRDREKKLRQATTKTGDFSEPR